MSIRGIGGNAIIVPFNETSDVNFAAATQTAPDVRAIECVTGQLAARTVSFAQPQQNNLQQEAQEIIEKHTSKRWFGVSRLGNNALGEELAAKIGEHSELAKAVFERLGKTEIYTA